MTDSLTLIEKVAIAIDPSWAKGSWAEGRARTQAEAAIAVVLRELKTPGGISAYGDAINQHIEATARANGVSLDYEDHNLAQEALARIKEFELEAQKRQSVGLVFHEATIAKLEAEIERLRGLEAK